MKPGHPRVAIGLASIAVLCGAPAPRRKTPMLYGTGNMIFDSDLGKWKTRFSRLLHPLSGSNDWLEMNGVTVVKVFWGGRDNLAEFKAD